MRYILLLSIIVLLIHCTSEKTRMDKIQSNIETFLNVKEYAGKGYAFAGISRIDTVTEKEFLDRQLEALSVTLMNKEKKLQRLDSFEVNMKKSLSLHPEDETLQLNLRDVIRSKTEIYVNQHKYDSLQAMITPEQSKRVKFIGLEYAFTTKNASGNPVMHHYYVKLDEQWNVISATDLQQ